MLEFISDFVELMPTIIVGFVVGLVAHEAGHCACAALASMPIKKIRIGVGPVLMRARLGKVELALHALPIGGLVQVEINRTTTRLRLAVFVLGGILANVALLGLAAWRGASDAAAAPDPATAGFAIGQFGLLACSVVPLWNRRNGLRFPNDAMQLILLLRGRHRIDAHRDYGQLLAHYADGRAPRATDASRVLREQMARGGLQADASTRRDIVDTLRRELAKDDMSVEERRLIIDTLVTMALISRDPVFYADLDDWSRQAAELAGASATNIRGVVLVELGEFAAGKALLGEIAKPDFATCDPFDMSNRIVTQAFIARAEGGLGDPVGGRRRLDRARQAIRANAIYEVLRPLVDRIDGELIAGRYAYPAPPRADVR